MHSFSCIKFRCILYFKKENCSKDPFASQENDIYNAKVKKYVGDEIKGSEVSLMLETIISMNQENAEQIGKFISVQVENIEGYSKSNKNSLEEECKKCNFYEDEMAENTVKNVRNATEEIRNLDRKINSSKKYKVEAKYEEGIIYKVIISENEKEDSNKKGKKMNDEIKKEKRKARIMIAITLIITISVISFLIILIYEYNSMSIYTAKPIIYLYPEEETEVTVTLGYPEKITTSYPKYENGWKITAKPDGTLIYNETGRELYSLYWEGENNIDIDIKEGFVVKGEESAKFLEEKLAILGLNEREAEEFIVYWLPQLEANKYNFIRFETIDKINKDMPLEINPKPDTLIRVWMEFKGLDKYEEVKEQQLQTPERKGFVAVEWGGIKLK